MRSTPKQGLRRWRRAGLGCLVFLGLCLGILTILAVLAKPAGQKETPAGYTRNEAHYVTMRDGVRIAIDVWYPADLAPGQKVPTVLRPTRYGRAFALGLGARLLWSVGLSDPLYREAASFNQAGYALVLMDVRGSGASFGNWVVPWSPDEVADVGEVIEWVVAQPWSDGQVGLYGDSYGGVVAELAAGLNHPAVKAVAPRYSGFDPTFDIAAPGGVFNQDLVRLWDLSNKALDANDLCALATNVSSSTPDIPVSQVTGFKCWLLKLLYSGARPVDDDPSGEELAAAIAARQNVDVLTMTQEMSFRDDPFGDSGRTAADLSPYGQKEAIERSGVAMFFWVNWFDAGNAQSALGRYLTLSNPQRLVLLPLSHSGNHHADPFLLADTPPDPPVEEHFQVLIRFFDTYLKEDSTEAVETGIRYYTLGEGVWKETAAWPPAGFAAQLWYFGPGGTLSQQAPTDDLAADTYTVDWTATTGPLTRWHSQISGSNVVYPDRAEEDRKLLTYTSAPLATDVEITGSPIVTLYVISTATDGAFHVYLEDVAPDGRVTYITEGLLRAPHRKESTETPPYVQLGPYHSYKREDAAPLVPGEVAELRFSLFPTSVLIRQGHRIRIAIAGHDASLFARYPAEGTPVLSVQRNAVYASNVELPTMER
jgi:putative CocE/NonD family hydrolase